MTTPQDRFRAYLLGKLSDEEQAELEQSYLADESVLEGLKEADSDLTDAYVRGQITAEDREAFESRLLSSPGRERKIAFARAFARAIEKQAARSRPETAPSVGRVASRPWLAAAAIAAGAFLVLLVVESSRLRDIQKGLTDLEPRLNRLEEAAQAQRRETERMAAERSRLQDKEGAPSSAESESGAQGGGLAVFTLLPGFVRDPADQATIARPEGKDSVVLELALDELTRAEYRATLVRVGGSEVWKRDRLRPVRRKSGDFVLLKVPAKLLTAGDYIVRLAVGSGQASEPVADYAFRVAP